MLVRILLFSLFLFPVQRLAAQNNQVQLARNAVGKLQVSVQNKESVKKQLAIVSEGLAAITLAKSNRKTRNWPETWAMKSYFHAYQALLVQNEEESDKFYALAQSTLDTAKLLDKEQINASIIKATVHNINIKKRQKGDAAFKEKDFSNAYQILKDLSDFYEQDTATALNVAISARILHQNEAALKYFKRAKDGGIKNPAVFQNLALLYASKLETNKAIETLEQGISLNPGNIALKNDYINLLLDNERYDKALVAVEGAITGPQTNERLFYIYGYLQQVKKEYEKAENAYKRAISLNPNYFDAFYQLGLVYLDSANHVLKDPEHKKEFPTVLGKAEFAMRKAHEINPNDIPTITVLIEIYKTQKLKDKVAELENRLRGF